MIPRSFAIGAHEVTNEQFCRFDPRFQRDREVAPQPGSPVTRVSWYDAVKYCRWLTTQEGLGESEQCYPENIGPEMKLPDNFFCAGDTGCRPRQSGSTLAGPAASRAGFSVRTNRCSSDYAWFSKNADDYLRPVGLLKPNPWGLFDVYGNSLEWCQNPPQKIDAAMAATPVRDDRYGADAGEPRILRGGGYLRPAARDTLCQTTQIRSLTRGPSFMGLRVARTVP